MVITAIKQQVKNPERVSVFVDGKYSFSLSLDELLAERLKQGIDIDEPRLKVLKKLSADGKIRMRALAWITSRPHSTREFTDYLRRKKVEPEQVESLITDFTSRGYLDDEYFAKWFTEGRRNKNKSTRAIVSELRSKGIDQVTIQNVVTEEGQDSEKAALKQTLNKLSKRPRYQDQEKLVRYLLSKGFNYGDIKEQLADDSALPPEPELQS